MPGTSPASMNSDVPMANTPRARKYRDTRSSRDHGIGGRFVVTRGPGKRKLPGCREDRQPGPGRFGARHGLELNAGPEVMNESFMTSGAVNDPFMPSGASRVPAG